MTDERILERDAAGRILPGSGGRPKGVRNKASRQVLEQIKAMGGDALKALWEAVHAKEEWAVRFVLGKLVPNGRVIEFEAMTIDDIIEALRNGDITPDEAKSAASVLSIACEIKDHDHMAIKLIELEAIITDGKKIFK
jgi:hypothetical protein